TLLVFDSTAYSQIMLFRHQLVALMRQGSSLRGVFGGSRTFHRTPFHRTPFHRKKGRFIERRFIERRFIEPLTAVSSNLFIASFLDAVCYENMHGAFLQLSFEGW
ncbi:MAG: hypothetical protein PV344_00645, partial [Anaplasma sp.]|nr:hypothetical protein [Anaplasma sp.]